MKSWRVLLVVLALALTLAMATACTIAAPTPTSTPLPTTEWRLEDMQVSGSTVTVSLPVFAGIDV
jgi:hypothetical protein